MAAPDASGSRERTADPDHAPAVGRASPGGDDERAAHPSPAPAAVDPELVEVRERWRRAEADLANLHKRSQRDLEAARAHERALVIREVLPVVDNLELALQHASADAGAIVSGVRAVREQAVEVLARLGYRRIEEDGTRFDAHLHEAAQVVDDAHREPGTVVRVLRPGYSGPAGLLRPAMVAVSQAPLAAEPTAQAVS